MKDFDLLNLILKTSKEIFKTEKDLSIQANELLNQFKGNKNYLLQFKLSNLSLVKNLLIYIMKGIYLFLLSIIFTLKKIDNHKKRGKIEVITVSQIISLNQNKSKDIYFGEVSNILKRKKIKHKKVYINGIGLKSINKKFNKLEDSNNLVINTNINLISLLNIYLILFKKFIKFFFLSLNFRENKEKRIILRIIAFEFLNPKTVNNLIIEKKFQIFFTDFEIKNLVITFEGFSWEKMIFNAARKISPKTRVIGYQFATLTNSQVLYSKSININFKPDIVWTSGKVNKNKLKKKFKNVVVVGTDRVNQLNKINYVKKNFNFLVLPEGINYEIVTMMKFSLMCAKNFPELKFIWRFHPSINKDFIINKIINKKIPRKIIISKKKLEEDITRCSFFFYRGSTTSITALQSGLYPVYLNLEEELNIDPLYDFNSWKTVVNTQSDFSFFIKNKIHNIFKSRQKRKMGLKFSKNYFMKLNPKIIYNSLSI